ncbi:ATP F0F1 synthase subunit I [Mesorhizobium loti]|nr:AtpZ/AtpI family protein [Mesorhizobium loti]PLP57751.1 ATP F0F1 synthase subunit I [Mesorhizobium loti]
MADKNRPDGTGRTGGDDKPGFHDDDLERRRRALGADLATRRPERSQGEEAANAGRTAGYGQAFKLSSEFIAGIAVGTGLGWMVDRLAGSSPWGLIVGLLLGFGAGILNVLRSAGAVAEFGQGGKGPDERKK